MVKINRELDLEKTPEESQEERDFPELLEISTKNGLERFSIAESLNKMFAEAENLPPLEYSEREIPEVKDREVLNFIVNETIKELKRSSEIRRLRKKVKENGYFSLTREERERMLNIFDRARDNAFKNAEKKFGTSLSQEKLRKIKRKTISQLNYSLRERIKEGGEPKAWMLLEPRLRKVHLMDKVTLIRYLKNSLNGKLDIKFVTQEKEAGRATEEMKEALNETEKDEGK